MSLGHGASIVRDGLVLHLDAANPKSYPDSGTVWKDLSGNSNNGTLVNGVGFDSDNNGSMVFDGVDDYIQLTESLENALNGNPEASLSMWIKLFSGSNGSGVSGLINLTSHNTTNGNLYFYTNADNVGGIWLNVFRTDRVFAGDWQPIFDGTKWHLLSITTEPGTNGWKMYLNDVLRYQTTGQATVAVNYSLFGGFRIGQNGTRELRGNIGHTQIYNRALTPEEVKQNFEALRGRYGI